MKIVELSSCWTSPTLIRFAHLARKSAHAFHRSAWSVCVLIGLAISTGFAGCVTDRGVAADQLKLRRSDGAPPKLIIVAVPVSAKVDELNEISTESPLADKDATRAEIAKRLEAVRSDALAQVDSAVTRQNRTIVCNDPASMEAARTLGLDNVEESYTKEMSQRVRESLPCADSMLRFRITSYGSTPEEWNRNILVATGVWIAASATLAYTNPKTRPYFGAYLASELVQESVGTYAGYTAFDKLYRPVRVEAELIDLKTGAMLWQGSNTGLATDGIVPYRLSGEGKAEANLARSTRAAVEGLVEEFGQSL